RRNPRGIMAPISSWVSGPWPPLAVVSARARAHLQGKGRVHPSLPWPHPVSVSGPHAPGSAVPGTPGGIGVHGVHLWPVHGPRLTGAAGSVGAVAKLAGSAPVSVPRNATISLISASGSATPNCTRPITCTASSSVATEPSWKYGGVIATFRRLGT